MFKERRKAMILHERLVTIEEDYEITEVEMDDSDLINFINLKYNAEDIINIAKQLDKTVDDADLDYAYSVILNNFDNATEDGQKDVYALKKWIEDEIFQNFDLEEIEVEDTSEFYDNFEEAGAPTAQLLKNLIPSCQKISQLGVKKFEANNIK